MRPLGRGFHALIRNVLFPSPTDVLFQAFPQGFKMRLLRKDFQTLIRNVSFTSPSDVGSHKPPSDRLVYGFDIICNSLNTPLADIVLFGLSLSGFLSRF